MNSISSIARAGLQAAQMQMHVAAHNIANAQTSGFQRQAAGLQAPAGAELVQDVVQQVAAMYTFQANVLTLQTQQKMLGSLVDTLA
jgi:flagellar hook protein FlgE